MATLGREGRNTYVQLMSMHGLMTDIEEKTRMQLERATDPEAIKRLKDMAKFSKMSATYALKVVEIIESSLDPFFLPRLHEYARKHHAVVMGRDEIRYQRQKAMADLENYVFQKDVVRDIYVDVCDSVCKKCTKSGSEIEDCLTRKNLLELGAWPGPKGEQDWKECPFAYGLEDF